MLLDEALDILDVLSYQLINDESLPLNKSDIMAQLDALEEIKRSTEDRIMESREYSKQELIQEIESLNSILKSKRDMLQMIISAVDHWSKA